MTRIDRSHAIGWEVTRWVAVVLFWIMALVVIAATNVKAQDADTAWVWRTYCNQSRTHCYDRLVRRVYAPRVYGYSRRHDDDDMGRGEGERRCRDVRKAVGDQHLTTDGAKKAANDSWAGAVRFHIGEKWMDLNNARHLVYTCSRSSIKEGGVTTLGQTLQRCELEAQPCAPLREPEPREDR